MRIYERRCDKRPVQLNDFIDGILMNVSTRVASDPSDNAINDEHCCREWINACVYIAAAQKR
jgi:hypothetical protein